MRTLIWLGLLTLLTACSAVPERSKYNTFNYQMNTNSNSWRYVWLPANYSDRASLKEKFSSYSSFYIAPTQLEVIDSELTEAQLREFADYLESEAQSMLADYKIPTGSKQAKGLTIQFALSNVTMPSALLATTSSVVPIGLAISHVSMLTTGRHTNVTSARIEVLISDGRTGEPLFSAIEISAGDKSLDNIMEPEEEIRKIFRVWVDKLEQTLNQVPTTE